MSKSLSNVGPDGKVPNRKLAAIRSIRKRADLSQINLAEWTTENQTIPSAVDPKKINPTILVGGATANDLANDGLNDEVWNSPAAENYRAEIAKAISDADTALSTIIAYLADAETYQIEYIGERVPPDSPEAVWDLSTIIQC